MATTSSTRTADLATLGGRLRYARSLVPNLSARELDRLVGNSEGHTALIEKGERLDPLASRAQRYAEILGLSLDWLVGGHGAVPSARGVLSAVSRAREAAA